jgi:hypothetical protein
MPYLVLALGAVLSICGALSIYFGYGIVEVERGWTGVIAGATALTGGIIVIALGLVIKSLGDLRATLKQAAAHDVAAEDNLPPEPEPEPYEDTGSRMGEGEEQTPSATPDFQSSVLAIIMASQNNLETTEPAPQSATHPQETGEPNPPLDQEAPEAPIPKPRQKVTLKPQAAAPHKDEPTPVPAGEPEAPSMDDWLDRAFSALDHEVASNPLRDLVANERNWPQAGAKQETARLAPEPLASEQLAPDRPGLDHAAHEAAKQDYRAPENEPFAPAQAGAEPAEIGRYEADGTSYIMYADGSIDIQSEAGVYRFSSMAELKAYIEGTE